MNALRTRKLIAMGLIVFSGWYFLNLLYSMQNYELGFSHSTDHTNHVSSDPRDSTLPPPSFPEGSGRMAGQGQPNFPLGKDPNTPFDHHPQPEDGLARPKTILDPSTKYLSFMTYAGLTNQFMALENAAYLAQQLDRVLIMPPITTNSHDKHNSNQRWSDFFDLPKFTELTGVRVVEWNDVRPMTAEQIEVGRAQVRMGKKSYEPWEAIAEDLPCQIIYGFGDSERLHTTELTFARQFLFRPRFIRPPPRNPKTIVHDRHKIGAKDNLNMDDIVTIEDLVGRYEDAADHLLFLSHSYKLKDPSGRQSWFKVGQYFHFRAHVLAFASELIQTRAPQTKGPSMRYIAIHLRRGDIWQKCRQETMEERMACLTPLSYYAEVVDKVRASLGQDMPVIVTTDSDSEEDFKTMEELKWARLDHASYSTESRLGIFGPAMVDAVILAEADVMVGTYVSSMSRVAARRQKSWHDRVALYPQTRRV